MGLEQKLSLRLSQRLVMTPSLQQAIKLLQMTRLELEGVLTQELVENPVLEENEPANDEEEEAQPEEVEETPEESDDSLSEIDLEAYFGDQVDTWEAAGKGSLFEPRQAPPIENTLTREEDLYDHLLWQLQMMEVKPILLELAQLIIGNLDPEGFLEASIEELEEMGKTSELTGEGEIDYLREDVEEALCIVRSFDPPGVACHSLQESLLLQLEALGVSSEDLSYRLVDEAWDQFKHRRFETVAKSFGLPLQALRPAVDQIKELETRPGRRYGNERTHYVEPDVHVVKVGDSYVVQLNDDGLPRLRVSRAYRNMLKAMKRDGSEAEAQQFIKDKMRSALWLIKSLDQRQRTIYKVANSIVEQQRAFLDYGIDHLRPMVLRDVADDIEMHESTVSRVVSNKYIHTPRGLLPLKFFFHSGIDREYGGDISSLTVKRKIEQVIREENPKKPLSDSELMRILNREGNHIARRTVAKYRDELGIPSSTDRRKIF